MSKKRVKIESTDSNGEKVTIYVKSPGSVEYSKAKKASGLAFKEALDGAGIFRKKLTKTMMDQGLWDEDKDKKLEELQKRIEENVKKLASGGMELSKAKDIAIQIRRDRLESTLLLAETREWDAYTVEGQAENASFDTLVACCTVDEAGKPMYKDTQDFLEKGDEPYSIEASKVLGELVYKLDPEWEKTLPENKFLLEYKFCNEDLSLVNEKGELVTVEGRRIDENGRYISADGGFEDEDGNPLDEDGNPIIKFKPFTRDGKTVRRKKKVAEATEEVSEVS